MTSALLELHTIESPVVVVDSIQLSDWLHAQLGPIWFTIEGKQPHRHRVVVTLLHGNEPSGTRSIWRLLQESIQPEVTIHFCIANIEAALAEDGFSKRHLDHQPDWNRCFGVGKKHIKHPVAAAILHKLEQIQPEAVVDLHNTSGTGPSFVVTSFDTPKHRQLAALFSPRLLHTEVHLGALMEKSTPQSPIVTVECGGVADTKADEVAYQGLLRFCHDDILFTNQCVDIELLRHPMRITLRPDTHVDFADQLQPQLDLTLPTNIEQLNFGWLEPHTQLGWLGPRGLNVLSINDGRHTLTAQELFYERDGGLYLSHACKLFMITPSIEIALSDCLFYMVLITEQNHQLTQYF